MTGFLTPTNATAINQPTVAVVGAGYWGSNLIRTFNELGALVAVCDERLAVRANIQEQYPHVQVVDTLNALLSLPAINAVALATPSFTHAPLGLQLLQAGKHLYVEKPLATTLADAKALQQLAQAVNKQLMVGHLLLYHPAYNAIQGLVASGALGELRLLQLERLNYNVGRADRNALWDLMPHDLAILCYLLGHSQFEVQHLVGHCLLGDTRLTPDTKLDHVAVAFKEVGASKTSLSIQVQASWANPKKQVQLLIVGSDASLVLDESLPWGERLKLIRYHKTTGQRSEELVSYLDLPPLKLECQHFLNSLASGFTPQSDDVNGVAVVALLETIQTQLDKKTSIPN
jgi:UDP-2-acetamido-3-amino-2,3-dideoxy-glucuronate N-acetyltransferase